MSARETKLVYVVDESEDGARLLEHPSEELIEITRDSVLIASSVAVEDEPAQGIVCAYLGNDRHWHFDHYLTRSERAKAGL